MYVLWLRSHKRVTRFTGCKHSQKYRVHITSIKRKFKFCKTFTQPVFLMMRKGIISQSWT